MSKRNLFILISFTILAGLIISFSFFIGCGRAVDPATTTSTTTSTSTTASSTSTSTTSTTTTTIYTITRLGSGTPNELTRVSFYDANNGWVAGLGNILKKTSDDGANWETISLPTGASSSIQALCAKDANNVWVGAGGIYYTSNEGTSFTKRDTGYPFSPYSIFFLAGDTRGWAAGAGARIRATTNGSTWTSQTSGVAGTLRDVYFSNESVGWITGDGKILYTTTGGTSWDFDPEATGGRDGYSISFSSSGIGWVACGSAGALKTTDGGVRWSVATIESTLGTFNHVDQIRFVDEGRGMLIGTISGEDAYVRYFAYTINGGTNWIAQPCNTTAAINHLCVVDMNTAYAVGTSGTILKISK